MTPDEESKPFPDEESTQELDVRRSPTDTTVRVIRCPKCKTPIETAMPDSGSALCARCFALMVNAAGIPTGETPARITFQLRAPADVVKRNERDLPAQVRDALQHAATDFGEELAEAFLRGDANLFKLLHQAKEHGLLLLVVVQPAMKAATTQVVRRPA